MNESHNQVADLGFSCLFAGPGRGDCEHFVGLPGVSIPGQHDGPDDTLDVYGKPNGWCWTCWRSYQISKLRTELDETKQHCALALEFLCQAGNGKQYDPSWIRPKLMSFKEIQDACIQAYHHLNKAIRREPK